MAQPAPLARFRAFISITFLIICLLLLCGAACGSAAAPPDGGPASVRELLRPANVFAGEARTLRSRSGQFIVRGLPLGAFPASGISTSEVSYVRLDPAVSSVSCERIKQAVLEELGAKDEWRGAVTVNLHPVREDNEPIVITSMRFAGGWSYRMEVPELVNRDRLVKALVEVLLLEMANRKAGVRPAELPPWLIEGLSAHVQATAQTTLTLEPATRVVRRQGTGDPLNRARELLRQRPALTLDQLSWPTEEQLAEDNLALYRSCAHLFVHELLRLKNGRACLREMVERLPEDLNWQTTFLRAFQTHFNRLIEVDKWWALNVAYFSGRDPMTAWSLAESCDRLDEILATPVLVRLRPGDLPTTVQAKVQSVIAEWDYARQTPILLQKINHLHALRLLAAQEQLGLIDGYLETLEIYLDRRDKVSLAEARKHRLSRSQRLLLQNTLRRLDWLDAQRENSRQTTNAPPVAAPQKKR